MTQIAVQDGKVLLRGDKAGTSLDCCCECCRCSGGPPFVDASCALQAVILQFDLSRLGVCKGAATLRIEAADQDLFFPFSKRQMFDTAGGKIVIEGNMWCLGGCVAVQWTIIPGPADGTQCDFCQDMSAIVAPTELLNGQNDANGICCPTGGSFRVGPNIPLCDVASVEVRVEVTCVY